MSESQALRTRSMDAILGVEALDFGLGIGEILTPKSFIQHLKQQSEVRHTFNDSKEREGMNITPVLHPLNAKNYVRQSIEHIDVDVEIESIEDNFVIKPVKIDMEDISDEIYFHNSSIICYVLGDNPPIQAMEGFFRRIWRTFKVDKVALINKGVYLVRFSTMGSRDRN